MLNDTKTWTSRNKWYGEVGDTFDIFEHTFQIIARYKISLNHVAEHWYDEGCDSSEDFIVLWGTIHPRKGFDPMQVVKVHVFRRIN